MEKRVEWTTKDLIEVLEEFVPIYETRPVKNNIYGMGFDQSFGPWFIARWLKLDLMIESGAFKDIQPGFCDKLCLINQLFHFRPGILLTI